MNLPRRQTESQSVLHADVAYHIDFDWGTFYVTDEAVRDYRICPVEGVEIKHDVPSLAARLALKERIPDQPRYDFLLASKTEFTKHDAMATDEAGNARYFALRKHGAVTAMSMPSAQFSEIEAAVQSDALKFEVAEENDVDESLLDGIGYVFDYQDRPISDERLRESFAQRLKADMIARTAESSVNMAHPIWYREQYQRKLMRRLGSSVLLGATFGIGGSMTMGEVLSPSGEWIRVEPVMASGAFIALGIAAAYKELKSGFSHMHMLEQEWQTEAAKAADKITEDLKGSFYQPISPYFENIFRQED